MRDVLRANRKRAGATCCAASRRLARLLAPRRSRARALDRSSTSLDVTPEDQGALRRRRQHRRARDAARPGRRRQRPARDERRCCRRTLRELAGPARQGRGARQHALAPRPDGRERSARAWPAPRSSRTTKTRQRLRAGWYVPAEDRYEPPLPRRGAADEDVLHDRRDARSATSASSSATCIEAHTDGDAYVRFPDVNVIAAGDVVSPRARSRARLVRRRLARRARRRAREAARARRRAHALRAELRPRRSAAPKCKPSTTCMLAIFDRMVVNLRLGQTADDMLKAGLLDGLPRTFEDPGQVPLRRAQGLLGASQQARERHRMNKLLPLAALSYRRRGRRARALRSRARREPARRRGRERPPRRRVRAHPSRRHRRERRARRRHDGAALGRVPARRRPRRRAAVARREGGHAEPLRREPAGRSREGRECRDRGDAARRRRERGVAERGRRDRADARRAHGLRRRREQADRRRRRRQRARGVARPDGADVGRRRRVPRARRAC